MNILVLDIPALIQSTLIQLTSQIDGHFLHSPSFTPSQFFPLALEVDYGYHSSFIHHALLLTLNFLGLTEEVQTFSNHSTLCTTYRLLAFLRINVLRLYVQISTAQNHSRSAHSHSRHHGFDGSQDHRWPRPSR